MVPGETLLESIGANRTQGGRAVGGHLYLTNHRLVFLPHRFDAATGGHPWEVSLRAVSLADLAPRGSNLFDGSMRRRLRVMTADDGAEHFVVSKPGEVASRIERAKEA
jgi:GRAM domain